MVQNLFIFQCWKSKVTLFLQTKQKDMSLKTKFWGNTRKPRGIFGIYMVNRMNRGRHEILANWALKDLEIDEKASALDIGCGGGANIARLLDRCDKVCGVDYSSLAVAKSARLNAQAIRDKRCEVVEGNAAALPFDDERFDLVTAFETIYFWPDITTCYRQVRRVLKNGGRFMIVNESDGTDPRYNSWENVIGNMHTYTVEEIESDLKAAGFTSVSVTRNDGRFIRVIAVK